MLLPFNVRPMTDADAPAVALLSEQFGYEVTPAVIAARLDLLSRSPGHGFYAAVLEGAVAGWVHVYGVHLLESPAPFAEIGGLVVEKQARRRGIGRALMAQAEVWAREHGYAEVRLRSGLHRTDAHEFYQRIGYTLAKTSHMFRKTLSSSKEAGNENLHGSP